MQHKFWAYDPYELFESFEVIPTSDMTKAEKLNALTRLSLVSSGVMWYMKYKDWWKWLIGSVGLIYMIGVTNKPEDKSVKENFTVTPTYNSTDAHTTTIAPTFAEEWHIPPPAYDIFQEEPVIDEGMQGLFEDQDVLDPRSYPYGQYLTTTNLLPSDEYSVDMMKGGHRNAREYVNSQFTRHTLAHRDNISRIYKKKLNRRFRHSNDLYSPYRSY